MQPYYNPHLEVNYNHEIILHVAEKYLPFKFFTTLLETDKPTALLLLVNLTLKYHAESS